jgi:hypothetical protein
VVLCVVVIGRKLAQDHPALLYFLKYSILPGLALLFGFSYKKQIEYITKKISTTTDASN